MIYNFHFICDMHLLCAIVLNLTILAEAFGIHFVGENKQFIPFGSLALYLTRS